MTKIEKAAKVIDSYLTCKDFNTSVSLTHEDGSKFKLQHPFYIKLVDYILVFTEHTGYYIFYKDEVTSVRQMTYGHTITQEELDRIKKVAQVFL